MDVQVGSFKENFLESEPLLIKHWEEVGMAGGEGLELYIRPEFYYRLEDIGALVVICARDNGRLVGYLMATVGPHPHHSHIKFALMDCLFIDKSVRGLKSYRTVCRMIELAKAESAKKGATYFQLVANANRPLDRLAIDLGMTQTDIVFTQRI